MIPCTKDGGLPVFTANGSASTGTTIRTNWACGATASGTTARSTDIGSAPFLGYEDSSATAEPRTIAALGRSAGRIKCSLPRPPLMGYSPGCRVGNRQSCRSLLSPTPGWPDSLQSNAWPNRRSNATNPAHSWPPRSGDVPNLHHDTYRHFWVYLHAIQACRRWLFLCFFLSGTPEILVISWDFL